MSRELTPDEKTRLDRILHGSTPKTRARLNVLDYLHEAEAALDSAGRNVAEGYGVESQAHIEIARLHKRLVDLLYDLEHAPIEGDE